MTGNLSFIENERLRRLISKGQNYREPGNINWRKCKDIISNGLDSFVNKTSAKINETDDKKPTGKRFIIASKHCSTKSISRFVSLGLQTNLSSG